MPDDEGVTLAVALDAVATPDERVAVAAWRGKSDATRRCCIAYLTNHEDAWPAQGATPRLYEPDGRICEYPLRVKPVYLSARSALQACAERLTEALRDGSWVLRYLPPDAGADRQSVALEQWRDLQITVEPALNKAMVDSAPPTGERRGRARLPAWLRLTGHRGPFLVHPGAVASRRKATVDATPKSFTASREVAALGHLERLLAASDAVQRIRAGKRDWEVQVRAEYRDMSGEAWLRIWAKAAKAYDGLSRAGKKPRSA